MPVIVRSADEFGEMAASFNSDAGRGGAGRVALDEAVGELRNHRGELSRLVEERTVALIAAHEEIEQAHRRRQDMHDRMRTLSSRLGATDLEGADLTRRCRRSPRRSVRYSTSTWWSSTGRTRVAGSEDPPTVWHPDRIGSEGDAVLSLWSATAGSSKVWPSVRGHWLSPTSPGCPSPPGRSGPAFADASGYSAWILSPVHDADGSLLALLGLGMADPVTEWNDDDIALVDSVAADLGEPSCRPTSTNASRSWSASSRTSTGPRASSSDLLARAAHPADQHPGLHRTPPRRGGRRRRAGPDARDHREEQRPLSVLIEDILTLSHLNSAVYAITLVPVDVDPLVDSACESLLPTAEAKPSRSRPGPAPGAGSSWATPDQLERLLLNLVCNAVKFTPPGGRIQVRTTASPSSVVISVSDTGIGIPPGSRRPSSGGSFGVPRPPRRSSPERVSDWPSSRPSSNTTAAS